MLVEEMSTPCVLMVRERELDGAGGYYVKWNESTRFDAAVILDNPSESFEADRKGLNASYTVTVKRGAKLSYNDIFKRLSDGTTFRVTSEPFDVQSPMVSTLDMKQGKAERWELTHE